MSAGELAQQAGSTELRDTAASQRCEGCRTHRPTPVLAGQVEAGSRDRKNPVAVAAGLTAGGTQDLLQAGQFESIPADEAA